jgi:hypothetical protein
MMTEHVTESLGAYLDGEVSDRRLRRIEEHLAACSGCRTELASLRRLSQRLKESAPDDIFKPTVRFVSELNLRLSGREAVAGSGNGGEKILWLAVSGAVGGWSFLQVVVTVGLLLSAAGAIGLLGNASAWILPGAQHSAWFWTALGFLGSGMSGGRLGFLNALDSLSLFGLNWVTQLGWQALIGSVYWGLLIFWWSRSSRRVAQASPAR